MSGPRRVKQRLAAIRHLSDWLVTGQVMPVNPAGSVRRPAGRDEALIDPDIVIEER